MFFFFFLHVLAPIFMLSRCFINKIFASEAQEEVCQECVVGWVSGEEKRKKKKQNFVAGID